MGRDDGQAQAPVRCDAVSATLRPGEPRAAAWLRPATPGGGAPGGRQVRRHFPGSRLHACGRGMHLVTDCALPLCVSLKTTGNSVSHSSSPVLTSWSVVG